MEFVLLQQENTVSLLIFMRVTFLEPPGANFTDIARHKLADLVFPKLHKAELALVRRNEDVIPMFMRHREFAVMAMETMAEGLYNGPVSSLVNLLEYSPTPQNDCRVTVLAGLELELNFGLIVRKGVKLEEIREVRGHIKTYGACRRSIRERRWRFTESDSNGQAAEDLSLRPELAHTAVLGPCKTIERYRNLQVVEENFQGGPAFTTFYLFGPKAKKLMPGLEDNNLFLLVCRIVDRANALKEVLEPFGDRGINLRYPLSYHIGGEEYAYVLNYFCRRDQARALAHALEDLRRKSVIRQCVNLGPFPVFSGYKS